MAKRGRPPHPDILTPREQEVLGLVREGLGNGEIGERLGISVETVKQHVSEILSKLGVGTREEAAAWAPEAEGEGWTWRRWVMVGLGTATVVGAVLVLGLLAWGVAETSEDNGAVFDVTATPTSPPISATASPPATAVLSPSPTPNLPEVGVAPTLHGSPMRTTQGQYGLWEDVEIHNFG